MGVTETVIDVCVFAVKARVANGVDGISRQQRSNSPSCLSSARVMSRHVAGVASPRLVPAADTASRQPAVTPVRKSACLGGQSLATSAAKRLLARPACRGGRMLPEQPAKHRTVKKKPKPKHIAHKQVVVEDGTNSRCHSEQKLPHTQASASPITTAPVVPANEKSKNSETVPAAALPRIVIKICQGKIVSPPTIATYSASSASSKKCTTERHSSSAAVDGQERKSADSAAQPTEKSDRLKAQPVSKPAKATAGSKSHPKIPSHSPSSKVLADRNSNIAYFDSSQLQNSGSFDKLSLDCCMKLYNKLRDQQQACPPSQSLSDNGKLSKHSSTSKAHHKSSTDRTLHESKMKKRSVGHRKQTSSDFESSTKMQAVAGSKTSTSQTQDCTVQLNRIKSVNDSRSSLPQSLGDSSCQIKSSIPEKSTCTPERQPSGHMYNLVASGVDDVADDCCSVTLTPRSHSGRSDAPVNRTNVPTGTETVPGSSIPLSKPQRSFSKRSHTPTENDSVTSSSPKKSRSAETTSSLLSSLLGHSVKDKCTSMAATKTDQVLSDTNLTHLQSAWSAATAGDKLCRAVEVPGAAGDRVNMKSLSIQHVKKAASESAIGPVLDTECRRRSEVPAGQKRCRSIDDDGSSLSGTVTKSGSVKKSRMSYQLGHVSDRSTLEAVESSGADIVSDATSVCYLPNLITSGNADTVVHLNTAAKELSSDSEPPSSDVGWMSPTDSPNADGTFESSSLPLRLRIRRLPDVSPVREIYNVSGQDVQQDWMFGVSFGMYHL